MNTQRQLVGMIVITASVVSFLAGYLLVQPHGNAALATNNTGTILDRFNQVASASATEAPFPDGLVRVTDEAVLSPVNDSESDGVLYYHEDNGEVSKLDLPSRHATTVSGTILPNLVNVIWSPDRKQVITAYSTRVGRIFKYYNYQTHVSTSLGATVVAAAFSPDGSQLALAESFSGETDLVLTKPNTQDYQTILKTHFTSIQLAWPDSAFLAMTVPEEDGGSSLYQVSLSGDLTKIADDQRGLQSNWSFDGSAVLYSSTAPDNTELLTLRTVADGNEVQMPLNDSANSCGWYLNGQAVICADTANGQSSVKEIDTRTLKVQTLSDLVPINPSLVWVSHLQDYVVLENAADHSLWAMKLPE